MFKPASVCVDIYVQYMYMLLKSFVNAQFSVNFILFKYIFLQKINWLANFELFLVFVCSICQVRMQSTFSTTPSCLTTLRWRSETSQSTTPSAVCTEQPTWWIMQSSVRGKYQLKVLFNQKYLLNNICMLTQWLAVFLINPLLFLELLLFMWTMGV